MPFRAFIDLDVAFPTFERDNVTMVGILLDMEQKTVAVIAKNDSEEASGIIWQAVENYIAQATNNNYTYGEIPLEAVLLARKLGFYVPDAKRKGFVSK